MLAIDARSELETQSLYTADKIKEVHVMYVNAMPVLGMTGN